MKKLIKLFFIFCINNFVYCSDIIKVHLENHTGMDIKLDLTFDRKTNIVCDQGTIDQQDFKAGCSLTLDKNPKKTKKLSTIFAFKKDNPSLNASIDVSNCAKTILLVLILKEKKLIWKEVFKVEGKEGQYTDYKLQPDG